jgi:hypothetical protein
MKRLISASLSVLVFSALAAPDVKAAQPATTEPNFVQLVLQRIEQAKEEQAQDRVEPAVNQPTQVKVMTLKIEQPVQAESPTFEYFEQQYLDRYGS